VHTLFYLQYSLIRICNGNVGLDLGRISKCKKIPSMY